MATARDKLVADWRHELHAAQDALAEAPSRAWFLEMRVRLFRFLLACYGKANWRTTPTGPDDSQALVFDQPEAQFLHGKPAKPPGKIQAVLKAVANAQGHVPVAGEYAAGLDPDSWVVVASASGHVNTRRLVWMLKREKVPARAVTHGDDVLVLVRASERQRALGIAAAHCDLLHETSGSGETRRTQMAAAVFASLLTAALIAMFVAIAAVPHNDSNEPTRSVPVHVVFFTMFAATFLIIALVSSLGLLRACIGLFDERGCLRSEVNVLIRRSRKDRKDADA